MATLSTYRLGAALRAARHRKSRRQQQAEGICSPTARDADAALAEALSSVMNDKWACATGRFGAYNAMRAKPARLGADRVRFALIVECALAALVRDGFRPDASEAMLRERLAARVGKLSPVVIVRETRERLAKTQPSRDGSL